MIRRTTLFFLALLLAPAGAAANFVFPDPLPPEEYGNILIGRASTANGIKPATFSHWIHRQKYTCRVCHFELQFNFQANTTEITEAANRAGMFCGACHDGKQLFGHTRPEDCQRCHSGDLRQGSEKFPSLWRLQEARYGNRIDWDGALAAGQIKPAHQLTIEPASEGGVRQHPAPRGRVGRGLRRHRPPREAHEMARLQRLPPLHLQHQEEIHRGLADDKHRRWSILRRLPRQGGLSPHGLRTLPHEHESRAFVQRTGFPMKESL